MNSQPVSVSDEPRYAKDDVDPQLRGCRAAAPLAALSIEFVAKPEEAHRARAAIPGAIQNALADVPGFAGCLVMITDREARLVSVLTFWAGPERLTQSSKRERWLHRILRSYIDHCLRVRTLDAYVPTMRFAWDAVAEQSSFHGTSSSGESVEQTLFGVS
jgi:hypothetical protein